LLPLAVLGGALAVIHTGWRGRLGRPAGGLILWAAWLAPMAGFVSIAGLMHRYYLAMLAPAIAALVGAGLARCWERRASGAWRAALAVLLVASTASTVVLLGYWPDWQARLAPPLLALTGIALVMTLLGRDQGVGGRKVAASGMVLGVASLLVVPAVWSMFPVIFGGDRHLPYAGPELAAGSSRAPADGALRPLVDRLTRLARSEVFLAATLDANAAAPLILATGRPVMAMGGFTGSDPILTVEDLAARVAAGEVRFFWIPRQDPGVGPRPARETRSQNAALLDWVYSACTLDLPEAVVQPPKGGAPGGGATNPSAAGGPGQGQPNVLYDCEAPPG
jgi:4-amino-4-deoxy-L-arabinose transferase-like glycosyltransferase